MSIHTEIRPCTSFASTSNTDFIFPVTSVTTKEDFIEDQARLKKRNYELSNGDKSGWTVVHQAARSGNETILRYIFEECRSGLEWLSLGNENGEIPLHIAVQNYNIQTAYTLIRFGSPINITTTKRVHLTKIPTGATPLDVALRTLDFALVFLIRLNGGQKALPFSPSDNTQKLLLKSADAIISQRKKEEERFAQDLGKITNVYGLNIDILGIVAMYALNMRVYGLEDNCDSSFNVLRRSTNRVNKIASSLAKAAGNFFQSVSF